MLAHANMPSPWKKHPESVVDKVLKRAEISKIARKLQGRLQLAQFKTRHGWEDLTLDTIEPKIEEEIRRKRRAEATGDGATDFSTSDNPHMTSAAMIRSLMSSPLKAPAYSEATGSSNGSNTGHRKRSYLVSFDEPVSSPVKRFRVSPTPRRNKTFPTPNLNWRNGTGVGPGTSTAPFHQLTQSSPMKPRRHQHFTTAAGPDVSLFQTSRSASVKELTSSGPSSATTSIATNFAAAHDDVEEDGLLPSFHVENAANMVRSSPPRTPLVRSRPLGTKQGEHKQHAGDAKPGEEGAGLLLYLAQSPSPAVPGNKSSTAMEPPSTPPPRSLALPSSMMTTPGGGNLFPTTPGQGLDFSEFLKFTPSPAPRTFKTPGALSTARTPLTGVSRRPLTFD